MFWWPWAKGVIDNLDCTADLPAEPTAPAYPDELGDEEPAVEDVSAPGVPNVQTRVYNGPNLIGVSIDDGATVNVWDLNWDPTLGVSQVLTVKENGETTDLIYGVSRALAVDPLGVVDS